MDERVEAMLFPLDACVQRRFGVVGKNGHRGLGEDRAVVRLFVDEVHRDAGDARAVGERLAFGVETGERGQERRMYVQHAARIGAPTGPARRAA